MVMLGIESKWAGGWSLGPSRNVAMALEPRTLGQTRRESRE